MLAGQLSQHLHKVFVIVCPCQEWVTNYLTGLGLPREKLVLGVATHGRAFALTSSEWGLGAPAIISGLTGPYSGHTGYLAYFEVSLC